MRLELGALRCFTILCESSVTLIRLNTLRSNASCFVTDDACVNCEVKRG